MEDDQFFIDKLVKDSVEDYKEQPHTSWQEMEIYLEQNGVITKSFKGLNSLKNVKTDIAVISGILAITAGVYFYRYGTEKQSNPKEIIENVSDTTSAQTDINSIIKIEEDKTEKDSSEKNVEAIDKNETVKIKVEIPVHKNVIIKKQIIIKDTLN